MNFALLNSDNIVVKVITGDKKYQSYYAQLHNMRCIPAVGTTSVGYIYEESNNRFVPKKPYSTWIFHEESLTWRPPIPLPPSEPNVSLQWSDEEYLKNNTKGWIPINN